MLASLKKVNDQVEELRKALYSLNIDKNNIVTKGFYVRQEYKSLRNIGEIANEFVGYKTSHIIELNIAYDTPLLGKVIDKNSNTIVVPRISIAFCVKNQDNIKNQCLDLAVKEATSCAKVLAKAAEVELGELLSINHSFSEVYVNQREMSRAELPRGFIGSSFKDMNVKDLSFKANVTAEWKII